MIQSFRHKGLERLYEKGDRRRIPPEYVSKVERVLARLDIATEPSDMNLSGYRLHPLKAGLAGHWAVSISRNWRLTFSFSAGNAYDVDLVDYH